MKQNNLVYTFLVVAALALVVGVDYYRTRHHFEGDKEQRRLFDLDVNQVTEIDFIREGKEVLLVRGVEGWDIRQPDRVMNADNEFIQDLLSQLEKEEAIEIAKEGAGIDWKIYGLDAPLATYRFRDSLKKELVFQISKERNFEGNHFLRKNSESKVWVVPSTWYDRAQRGLLDFRDRRFFKKRMASISGVVVRNTHGSFHIENQNNQWVLLSGKQALDQNKVRQFLKGIAEAKVSDFEIEGILAGKALDKNLDLSKWGLQKPKAEIVIKLGEGSWRATVGQNAQFQVFSLVEDPGFIGLMESGAIDDVLRFTENDFKVDASGDKGATREQSTAH